MKLRTKQFFSILTFSVLAVEASAKREGGGHSISQSADTQKQIFRNVLIAAGLNCFATI